MNEDKKKPSVYETMKRILRHMNSSQEQNHLARDLATIRNSIGKKYEDAIDVWEILFPLLPDEYLGNGSLTGAEKAVFITLQLYAAGQQGTNKMLFSQQDHRVNIGESLGKIRNHNDSTAMDRRFNTMLTATTFDELTYHLRQLFKLGRSNEAFIVDFPTLAEDLFWYQKGKNKQICLNWARGYYRSNGNTLSNANGSSETQQ